MEPEGSLPHSQVTATCPYPQPARSSSWATSLFLKILLNIILPSKPGSSKWFPSLRFPHQNSVYASPLPHTRYMPRPSNSFWFYNPNNTGWGVQIIKLIIMWFSPLPCYLVPIRPKYPPQHPILKHRQPAFLPECERRSFTPIQNNRQNCGPVYLNLYILDNKLEDRRFCTEWQQAFRDISLLLSYPALL